MNKKVAEWYIKDQLRKKYGTRRFFCENRLGYVGSLIEIEFTYTAIRLFGYKSGVELFLDYPAKDGYIEETLNAIIDVIEELYMLELVYSTYKEVI